ncbi:MAG: hypothetical protein ACK44A_07080 [Roseateles sp.]
MFLPLARIPLAFRDGQVDAAMTDLGEDLGAAGGHYGNAAVFYDNLLFTLARRGLSLRRPQDLDGLTAMAFQGAARRYPEWLEAVQRGGRYFEVNDQAPRSAC